MIELDTFIGLTLLIFYFTEIHDLTEWPMIALAARLECISKPHSLTFLELHFHWPSRSSIAQWTTLDNAIANPRLSALVSLLFECEESHGRDEVLVEGWLAGALPRASARGTMELKF